ncbi:DNA cytosine methyltransferase, partial [Glaesserella parasuis]|uniref:DNA cytosine methyltransferase n=1 Tax=Glaesserella parasuis TaxID=738 RepID=UPI00156BA925
LSWVSVKQALEHLPDPDGILANTVPNNEYSQYKVTARNFTGHRTTNPDLPSPTILARGNGGGGVVAIPHYNGKRRMTVRESACIQSFPDDFEFKGTRGSGYRQVGNAVPVKLANVIAKQVFESLRQG